MTQRNNPFQMLADRAQQGDDGATDQLHHRLENQLIPIVRRTLRQRSETSTLDQKIFATARRLGLRDDAPWELPEDAFIRKVARSVCSHVIGKLKPSRERRIMTADTVTNFSDPSVSMTN